MVACLILSTLLVTPYVNDPGHRAERFLHAPPVHEIAAAFGFVAIPAAGVILAKLVVGVFVLRYALPAVIGLSILFAFAAYRQLQGRAATGAALLVTFASWFVVMQVMHFQRTTAASVGQLKTYEFLQFASHNELPIVVSDPQTFMKLVYYAPPDIAPRFVYLAAPEASLRYLGHNTVDRGMLDLKHWFHLRIEAYESYVLSQQRFLVHARFFDDNGKLWHRGQLSKITWLLSELTRANRRIELLGRNADDLLFLVTSEESRSSGHGGSTEPVDGRETGIPHL
jgi:hypothetical protein